MYILWLRNLFPTAVPVGTYSCSQSQRQSLQQIDMAWFWLNELPNNRIVNRTNHRTHNHQPVRALCHCLWQLPCLGTSDSKFRLVSDTTLNLVLCPCACIYMSYMRRLRSCAPSCTPCTIYKTACTPSIRPPRTLRPPQCDQRKSLYGRRGAQRGLCSPRAAATYRHARTHSTNRASPYRQKSSVLSRTPMCTPLRRSALAPHSGAC